MVHSYLAEALLYLDKISDSIEHLTINARIESDNDISFLPTIITESVFSETMNEQEKQLNENYKSILKS